MRPNKKKDHEKPSAPNTGQACLRLDEKGWTLMELMIVVALIAIVTPAITYLFVKMSQGMAGDEMRNQLQSLNSQTQLRIHERIEGTRHLMQGDSSGASFLAAVTLGMAASTKTNYPILAGSKLAVAQPPVTVGSASLSPGTAVAADFGNSLLYGAYDSPQSIANVSYPAPITAYASSITYSGGANKGMPATLVIDLYRFYYYYLTTSNTHPIPNVTTYRLVEWQSIQYADYFEINAFNDNVLQTNVIKWLVTQKSITNAWDPTQSMPVSAFYTLDNNGNANNVTAAVTIQEAQALILTHVSSGILSNGFGYGIAPNSANWPSATATVPLFAVANGNFPGGFEVGITGNATGRSVLTRLVVSAKGASPMVISNDVTMVHNVRDLW